jgi:hypothetical protein
VAISQERGATIGWTEEHFYNNAHYVRQLLKFHPSAVRLLEEKAKAKRSSLCVAIASGLHWTNSDQSGSNTVPGVVQSIWEIKPDALLCRTGGLYPFMLVACSVNDDEKGVETIFSLLRLSPQLIDTVRK